jgi:hypothetical protein
MPTIEIISVDASSVPDIPRFEGFAYIAEPGVISHRGLFQDELEKGNGIIVHLANKDFEGEEDGGWFAGGLMEWEDADSESDPVVFERHRFSDVVDLLKRMIEVSPKNEAIFLTDYQFGPEEKDISNEILSLPAFVDLHQQRRLRYNTLYRIKE